MAHLRFRRFAPVSVLILAYFPAQGKPGVRRIPCPFRVKALPAIPPGGLFLEFRKGRGPLPSLYFLMATPHNSARGFDERFCSKIKFGKRRNTVCISSFSNCKIGAKDLAKTADAIVRCCPYSNVSAMVLSHSVISRCCGQCSSHWRQPMQSDALPAFSVAHLYSVTYCALPSAAKRR